MVMKNKYSYLRRQQVQDDLKETKRILELERGSTGLRSVENSLTKRIWTCRKTGYGMVTLEEVGVSVVKYRSRDGHMKQVNTQNPQIIGATVKN
jgi:hypothetical protein